MKSESANVYNSMAEYAFKYTFYFGLLALITLIAYAVGQGGHISSIFSLLGIVIVIAFASAAAGGFIGFLFGIPHSVQQSTAVTSSSPNSSPMQNSNAVPQSGATSNNTTNSNSSSSTSSTQSTSYTNQQSKYNFTPSTNLEQIADWLTKIIVGVGLIELHKIILHFNTLCLSLGNALQKVGSSSNNSAPLAGAVIIIFLIIGFLIIYLWTYLYLIGIQSSVLDAGQIIASINATILNTDTKDKKAIDLANIQLTLSTHNPDLPITELIQSFKEASQNVISSIFFKAVTVRKQYWRDPDNKTKIEKTIPIFTALITLDNDFEFPENYLELGYALIVKAVPDYQNAFMNIDKAINAFGSDNGRIQNKAIAFFNRAYCRIELDDNYKAKQPSTPESKTLIQSDLSTASKEPYVAKIIENDPILNDWKQINP